MLLKKYACTIIYAITTLILFWWINKPLLTCFFIVITLLSFFKDKSKRNIDQFMKECQDDQYFNELIKKNQIK